jgi:aldehyde dehydrogenase (NAD+)
MIARCSAIIGGKEVTADTTFEDIDPSTGMRLADVDRCGQKEIDQAVSTAATAYENVWGDLTPAERSSRLVTLAGLISEHGEELAEMESRDVGKPLSQARNDVRVAARYFEYYGHIVEALYGHTIPTAPNVFAYTLREPFGVTGHIVPWNYPLQITARTVAPALAAGNCVVVKSAEEAPLTPFRLAQLAMDADFPPGVLNVVPGLGPEAGQALSESSGVGHISFTGSPQVGTLVSQTAAEHHTPVVLELGGKSPHIIFADADIERCSEVIVRVILQNAGQTCFAGSRLLVAPSVHERLVSSIAERFGKVTIGSGMEDKDLGPLISDQQRSRVRDLVENHDHGGRLICGGRTPSQLAQGYYYEPTLVDDVRPTSLLAQEEVFGPVLTVSTFADEADALRIANGTEYGLIAAIWTSDLNRAHRMASRLNVGQVYVNSYGAGTGVELPFGGTKRSGHGRERGFEGLLGYTHTKSVSIDFG